MSDLTIDLTGPMTKTEAEQLAQTRWFNHPYDDYITEAFALCTKGLTASEKAEVEMWNKGDLPKGWWDTVSRPAYESIMTLVSLGLG